MLPRVTRQRTLSLCLALCSLLVVLPACQSAPQSTRITVGDILEMSDAMATSLAVSDAFQSRNPQSTPWYVSITNVENRSSDVLPERERWTVMNRLRNGLPMQELYDDKNVRFVIPPQRARQYQLNDQLNLDATFAERRVTHTLTAVFESITRAASSASRTDAYFCRFELIDLATGDVVWTDRFEYKRSATGEIFD